MISFVILFAACQEEYVEISEPDKSTAFTANDTIADLILRVTMKDGSFDNIIDKCSAISIQYPYSVQIRNEIITIKSTEDIEALKAKYFPLRNNILINFPVTVIFSDYSEKILSNQGELQKIRKQYNTRVEDDDIECIDFIYPVELSLYNTEFQKPDFVRVGNDKDFHGLLKNMNDLIVEITYPVEVEFWNGERLSINNNDELENEILNTSDRCDENDEVEFSINKNNLKIQ